MKRLTSKDIVENLVGALKPLDYVYAFYEGGARAFDRVDEWSDLDLYLVVQDERVRETFAAVEKVLVSLSPIKQKLEIPQLPWPGVSQAFYKLENASEYLLIDLAVLKLNSPEKFTNPDIHGNVVFHFNKAGKVEIPELNKAEFVQKLQQRLDRLKARFSMFNIFVQKEINRGNYLEAIDLYYTLTLATLVEALRIEHNPLHYDFRMRYIHCELPSKAISKLEDLYYVKDEHDLKWKYRAATKWFKETVAAIDQK